MKWKQVKLESVCDEITKGTTPRTLGKNYVSTGIPFLRVENIQGNEVKIDQNTLFIDKETEHLLSRSKIFAGDILLTIAGTIGRGAIVPDNLPIMNCNQAVAIIRISGPLDRKFLLYWLKTSKAQFQILGAKVTATISNLSLGQIKKLIIPLPPLSEQRRIVEILDLSDALRKRRAEADSKYERIITSLFYKMFGDPAKSSEESDTVSIRTLISKVLRRDPSEQPNSNFKYIDISGIDGTLGKISHVRTLIGSEAPSRARQIVKAKDVIISTVRPYLRATALVPSDLDNQVCSTGFCVLRAKESKGFGYLFALSRLSWFTQQLNERARGASYPAVTDNDIFSIKVPYPKNSDAITRFDKMILSQFSFQKQRLLSKNKMQNIFSVLLHQAFSSKLTAKWQEAHMKELLKEMEEQAKYLQEAKVS